VAVAGGGSYDDFARVTRVDPQYESVNAPRKECFSEYVPERSYRGGPGRFVGPLLGGVTGGLLGAQVGEGNGRVAASAAGAAIGALVGDRLAQRDPAEYYEREVRRCRVVDNWEKRLTGYHVSYEYQGRPYATFLTYDPGPRLPVRVSVVPAGGGDGDPWQR
jgi:uncharacterized protein YcfJ